MTLASLLQYLAKLRRSEVVRVIIGFAKLVSSEGGMDLAVQLSIAQQLLPGEVWTAVSSKVPRNAQHAGRLFHRRQLWFLLQLALMVCSEESPEVDANEMDQRVSVSALMASDVLVRVELLHAPDVREAEDTSLWIATATLAAVDHRPGNEMLCRAISFWLDMPNDPALEAERERIGLPPVDSAFAEKYGLSIKEFLSLITSVYFRYMGSHIEVPPKAALIERHTYSDYFSTADLDRSFGIISATPDDLAYRLMGARQSWATDFTPLLQKPVLEVFPGKHACPDMAIFTLYFMDGLFHLVEDAMPQDRFRQFFGSMFSSYINRLLGNFLYAGDALVRSLFPNPHFVGTNDEAGDSIVQLSGMTLVMEHKGNVLTTRQKYATDLDATASFIDDQLAKFGRGKKGVGQLADVLRRIVGGESVHVANRVLPITPDHRFVPVIVLYDDSLGMHCVRDYLQRKLSDALADLSDASRRIGPLLLLTTRDVEVLEECVGEHSLDQLMEAYLRHVQRGGDSVGNLHGFLYSNFRPRAHSPSFVKNRVNAYLEELMAMLEARKPNGESDDSDES